MSLGIVACTTALSATACATGGQATQAPPPSAAAVVDRVKKDPALHAELPAVIQQAGVVRVASDVPYPPFEMFTADGASGAGSLTGLDYDLGRAIGKRLGVRFAFTPHKFDGIVPAIHAGKYDAAMSAMTDTRERQRVLDFVDYSLSGTGLLVRQGNPTRIRELKDLCGRKVAAQAATNQAALIRKSQSLCTTAHRAPIELLTYPKDSDAQLALSSRKVDASAVTKPAAGYIAKTVNRGTTFDLVEDPRAPGGYDATPNGIAVTKKLPALTRVLRKALQSLIDDGTYTHILDTYGVGSIGLRQATINAAKD
ncbi:hypothetical protein CCS38_09990 [Streptomyces purpurogeneiscleroticus]|nr:hypothetical protein [Streptomyces purpurogeneiscleroticus]